MFGVERDNREEAPPKRGVVPAVTVVIIITISFMLVVFGVASFARWVTRYMTESYPLIPVSGQVTDVYPTPLPGLVKPEPPNLLPQLPEENDRGNYQEVVEQALLVCYASFKTFYIYERMAFQEPLLTQDKTWRADASLVTQQFLSDCQSLRDLPAAPDGYEEVQHWLTLAGNEVGQITRHFKEVIEAGEMGMLAPGPLESTIEHMIFFVEYTNNAEDALSGVQERKEI